MTENFYHRRLKAVIQQICEASGKYKRIKREKKIWLTDQNTGENHGYLPELHCETKNGKLIIFEVLDDQLGDLNLVVADIILSFLAPNVQKVIFVAPLKEDDDLVWRLGRVIGGRLLEKGLKKNELPEVFTYKISRTEARGSKLKSILEKYAKKDSW
jgi:hypothetical protein